MLALKRILGTLEIGADLKIWIYFGPGSMLTGTSGDVTDVQNKD